MIERFDPCATKECKRRCDSWVTHCQEICIDEIAERRQWAHVASATLARFVSLGPPIGAEGKWAEVAEVAAALLEGRSWEP